MTPPRKTSTRRVGKHRAMLETLNMRYRSILVHDDDVEQLRRYAARLLKRHPLPTT